MIAAAAPSPSDDRRVVVVVVAVVVMRRDSPTSDGDAAAGEQGRGVRSEACEAGAAERGRSGGERVVVLGELCVCQRGVVGGSLLLIEEEVRPTELEVAMW